MRLARAVLILSVTTLLAVAALIFAVAASGHEGDRRREGQAVIRSTLTPSLRTDSVIHGVAPGGVDWALTEGRVRIELGQVDQALVRDDDDEHDDHGDDHGRHGGHGGDRGHNGDERRLVAPFLRLHLRVEGLVIRGTTGPGPVSSIGASIFCGSDTAPAVRSQQVPLSARGDAHLDASTSLAKCLAPVVLVHPNGDPTHYIAVSGFGN